VTVFELKGRDLVYLIDYCGAFQAGQFGLGQAMDYREDNERLYMRNHDNLLLKGAPSYNAITTAITKRNLNADGGCHEPKQIGS